MSRRNQRALLCAGIPEDPQAADVYYNQDGFDSCSEDEEAETPADTLHLSEPQASDSSFRVSFEGEGERADNNREVLPVWSGV